nr:DUF1272 domain-containing protein [Bacillus pseudomycoides]
MALEMKTNCQTCNISLQTDSEAYICTYECTFYAPYTEKTNQVCPNCGGELVRRPRKNNKSKATRSFAFSLPYLFKNLF